MSRNITNVSFCRTTSCTSCGRPEEADAVTIAMASYASTTICLECWEVLVASVAFMLENGGKSLSYDPNPTGD